MIALALVLSLQTAAANEFVLAWSDDGASALLLKRSQDDAGAALSLLLVDGRAAAAKRFALSATSAGAEQVSVKSCQAQVAALAAQLKALGFVGVQAQAKACGRKDRGDIVRTLKRHAEDAGDNVMREDAAAPGRWTRGPLEAKVSGDTLTFSAPVLPAPLALSLVPAEQRRFAVAPSVKLLLVTSGNGDGSSLGQAFALGAQATAITLPAP